MTEYDLVVIGSGPAGYTGAIRASQLGMKVACIEKRSSLGGTCLNVGCIPSKALLNFSEKYEQATKHFSDIGIEADIKLKLKTMLTKKDQIVGDLCKGISGLFAKNKITSIHGHAKISSTNEIIVTKDNGESETVKAKNILIAAGSEAVEIPSAKIDEQYILSSTGALSLNKVPKHLVVIGGGYIGLELGSVWRRLGAKVTVVEYADRIVPGLDQEIGKNFHKILAKQGMEFMLSTKLDSATVKNEQVQLSLTGPDNKPSQLSCDKLLIAVGRKANSHSLGLDSVGIELDKYGRIMVNASFQTRVQNIYAVGDIINGPMLAHKAEEEAVAAVEIMNQQAGHVDYNIIPGVVYTEPEVASVGLTEEQLKEQNIAYKVGKFPFLANSRARAMGSTEGMVKILACANTDKILGGHIIGPEAGTMIAEIAAYMEFGGASEDLARTCHAHPTLNEAIKEAALAIEKRTINF